MNKENHPCFDDSARHKFARIHLPVAPKCNIQCNYCDRKFDCLNESRPGVSSTVLNPLQAIDYLKKVVLKIPNVSVVGIAGPGDPFANPEETMATLRLVRKEFPYMLLCVATNGLEILPFVDELAKLNVSHVTITMNATDPAVAEKIYSWVRFAKKIYRGIEAAKILLAQQEKAIKALKAKGITVKINTVVIPEINDSSAKAIALMAKEWGAGIINFIPMMHVEGTAFESIHSPATLLMDKIKALTAGILPQMSHCNRCRADAAGLIGQSIDHKVLDLLKDAARPVMKSGKPYVAAASQEGIFVNRHLGESDAFWIFGLKDGEVELAGRRSAPPPGGGTDRWLDLAQVLHDCSAVLVSGVGATPKLVLESHEIQVIAMDGMIHEAAKAVLTGREIPKILLKQAGKCGAGSCGGTGGGCG